jgi:hypothetical protein
LFVHFLVLVLSIAVLVLVLESIQYSNPTYWSSSSIEPPRSTIGIAAVRTAIEYECRFTEYRFAENEYDEIRCEARTAKITRLPPKNYDSNSRSIGDLRASLCSCVFSYSYSNRSSIAIRPIGPQFPANRLDQRSASLQFEQPSSTSTVSLSTASLSTSTTKSDEKHERLKSPGCRRKTTIQIRGRSAALVHHFVRAFSPTRTRIDPV